MVTLQSVQDHAGVTHPFKFIDIRALWRSEASARVPKCQNIRNGGLDQYGAERFGRLAFTTTRKKCGTERVNFWWRSSSSWPTFNHSNFNHMAADKHLTECSSSLFILCSLLLILYSSLVQRTKLFSSCEHILCIIVPFLND